MGTRFVKENEPKKPAKNITKRELDRKLKLTDRAIAKPSKKKVEIAWEKVIVATKDIKRIDIDNDRVIRYIRVGRYEYTVYCDSMGNIYTKTDKPKIQKKFVGFDKKGKFVSEIREVDPDEHEEARKKAKK